MGKIIKNGVPYGGSNNNALNIKYNNANSGLAATTAQAAIDELANKSVDVTTDKTLSLSDKAADADAVGKAISGLDARTPNLDSDGNAYYEMGRTDLISGSETKSGVASWLQITKHFSGSDLTVHFDWEACDNCTHIMIEVYETDDDGDYIVETNDNHMSGSYKLYSGNHNYFINFYAESIDKSKPMTITVKELYITTSEYRIKELAYKDDLATLETALGGYKIRVLSESEYANLGTYDANTIYYCYK